MTNRLCLNCRGRDSRDAHVHPHVPLTLPMPQSACASFVSNSFCTVRDRQTETRPFVSVRCVCQGRPSYGGTNSDVSSKLKVGGVKIQDQPINTRNLVSWLSGKSLKLLPPKWDQIWYLVSVRLSLGWSLTLSCCFVIQRLVSRRQNREAWSRMFHCQRAGGGGV